MVLEEILVQAKVDYNITQLVSSNVCEWVT